jgi:prepilin-type N-terminal cleavage/methylation domain-containing protein
MKIQDKKGFSLMEVMLAVFVLSVGLVAIIGLISSSIRNSIDSRDTIIASELAQEGVELVRNIRDNNFLNKSISDADYPFETIPMGTLFRLDYNLSLVDGGPYQLKYYNNFYTYSGPLGTEKTKFYRAIITADFNSGAGRKIISTVWWDGNPTSPVSCNVGNKCVSVDDILAKR